MPEDPTARYLSRVFPARVRVLGVDLLPFTLGHAHVLAQATDWRPLHEFSPDTELLATGVYVCSRPWHEASRCLETNRPQKFARRLGRAAAWARVDISSRAIVFSQYLVRGTTGPAIRPPLRRQATPTTTRPCGAPLLSRLRLFAFETLHQDDGGMDMLFADVLWMWATAREQNGDNRVENDDEKSFSDWCDEQDRIEAEKQEGTTTC